MKTTKEFPATHSMSMDWFFADEDGNIALFDFDENGPVPVGVPCESNSTLMTDEYDFGAKDSDSIDYFELTDEQVEELMNDAVSPDKYDTEKAYYFFVQIENQYKKEFIDVFKGDIEFCLSHKHGIYFLSSLFEYEGLEETQKRRLETFYKVVKRAVYICIDAYWDDEEELKDWPLPFYCYKQPYDPHSGLAKRTNVPKFPFKEEQIPENQRNKLIRIPVKFSECTGFQIAQYAICCWYSGGDLEHNNRDYVRVPKTEGGYCYILKDQDKEKDGETPVVLDEKDI